jgi:hypothetical protein
MRLLTDLWQDLVEKRLWPIAVALVAVAVAVPVLLSKSPAGRVAAAPARTPRAAAGDHVQSGSAVTVGSTGFRDALSRAPLKDPFKQQHIPSAQSTTSIARATATAPAGTGASGLSTGQTGAQTVVRTGGATTGRSGGGTRPRRVPATRLKLQLRFGVVGGTLKTYEVVALRALPSASNPVLIYLGMLKDGKTASFLVSSGSSPQGDGTCKPSPLVCRTLLMKKGDKELLKVEQNAGAVQYRLTVKRLVRR